MLLMILINYLISAISILVSVAFYTILERKILSYIQTRKGPNKVGIMGIVQPFSDAIKLFNKNLISTETMNFLLSYSTPSLSLLLSLILVMIIPFFEYSNLDNKQNILFFFIISSLAVYSIIMVGWSSNSKYAHMGALRSIAQMISYEVSLFLIILFFIMLSSSYYFKMMSLSQNFLIYLWGNMIMFIIWMMSCLAEVNRSPFDFAEGESELVSGFNVEYMGGWFAMIFLAEYLSMVMLSLITMIIFFKSMKMMLYPLLILFISMTMLWVRGSYPRFRYDLLMKLNWKIILPSSLFIIIFPMWVSIYSF